jgi:hypothetical protein
MSFAEELGVALVLAAVTAAIIEYFKKKHPPSGAKNKRVRWLRIEIGRE